jgi:dUTP pyrophosphatase
MRIKFKKLNEKAIEPTRATIGSVGYDLHACLENALVIEPGETVKIGTGLAFGGIFDEFGLEVKSYGGFIYARSGLATKEGLAPPNKVGVIDPDYRGEVGIAMHNHSKEPRTVKPGQRIAQLVFQPVLLPILELVDSLDETDRGAGGFGSTGD